MYLTYIYRISTVINGGKTENEEVKTEERHNFCIQYEKLSYFKFVIERKLYLCSRFKKTIHLLRYGRKATPRKKQKAKGSTLFRDSIYLPHHRLRADMVGATFYKLKT